MPIASKTKPVERPPLMVLYMGTGGTGKTTAGITFPDPLVVDGEGGTRHYASSFNGAIRETKSYGDLLSLVRQYRSTGKCSWKEGNETVEFSPKTLVVDPMTSFWESIQAAKFMSGMESQGIVATKGTEKPKADRDTFQAWGAIKMHYKILMSEAQTSGLNFVCCAHEKEEMKSEMGPRGMEVVKTGQVVADMEKSYSYIFDLILRLVFEGGKRYAIVVKSRLKDAEGKDRFQMGQKLEQWDYNFLTKGMSSNVVVPKTESEAEAAVRDNAIVEKNPESSKLAHELRSRILPKYEIKNEDIEMYVVNKKLKDGVTPMAKKDEDGKVHLSEISPDMLKWLINVVESDTSRTALLKRIEELKGNELDMSAPKLVEAK